MEQRHPTALYPLLAEPVGNVYSVIACLLLVGLLFGFLAKQIRLPRITGNIFAGLLLGPIFGVINTSSPTIESQLEPLISLALSLIAISIGSHLRVKKLYNARLRIVVLTLLEVVFVPLLVFTGIFFALTLGWQMPRSSATQIAFWLSILAIATSPATILHVVEESQAKGIFVKTLIAVVVLNNVLNIAIFEVAKEYMFDAEATRRWLVVSFKILGSVGLGAALALTLIALRRHILLNQRITTYSLCVLVISYGIAVELNLSPVVANLVLGITLANFSDRNLILDTFEEFEEVIFALFFTLTGTHAHLVDLGSIGIVALIYLFCRVLGNIAAVSVAKDLMPLPSKVGRYLGPALTPQAGITIGLVIDLAGQDQAVSAIKVIIPIVLTAVTLAEIIGPILLRFILARTGEEGQAQPRIISFIQEEYITLNIKSRDKEGVIKELVDFFYKTHTVKGVSKEEFLEKVLSREHVSSTGIGKAIAIPHASLPEGNKIRGVMGVIPEGVEWDAIDGRPVHMVVLVVTPPAHEKQYLGVISTLARLFNFRTILDRRLHMARTPADVYEAIADEEFLHINRVIEEA